MGSKFQEFQNNPFIFVDNLKLTIKGINLNFFQKYRHFQNMALYGAVICLLAWAVFGFDSTPLQFIHALYEGVPLLLEGGSLAEVAGIYNLYYGKEMHYSAFVIYGLLYWGASKAWEKAGVTKSKNMAFSFAGMFLAIAVFEWFWILGFANFQNQPWVATWQFPQMRILLQNSAFTFLGVLAVLYMLTERYHWSWEKVSGDPQKKPKFKLIQGGRAYWFDAKNWKLWLLVFLSIGSALIWIYYPGHIDQIQVELETGEIWESSRMFPQTLYTIDLDPTDDVNAGEWFWVENNMIHGVNTVVKIFWAFAVYYLFKPKPLKPDASIMEPDRS